MMFRSPSRARHDDLIRSCLQTAADIFMILSLYSTAHVLDVPTVQTTFWPWLPGSPQALLLHPLSVTTATLVLQAHCRRLMAREKKEAGAICVEEGAEGGAEGVVEGEKKGALPGSASSSVTEEDEDRRDMAVLHTCTHTQCVYARNVLI